MRTGASRLTHVCCKIGNEFCLLDKFSILSLLCGSTINHHALLIISKFVNSVFDFAVIR